ncbi:hypothetical protein GCM10007108_12410 [Thermogymnomonas acidicola]|uniref:Uncharacterized protein n=1 Tax=Thermogymnomonas acidicola TaxID=399579 RepID=A0AA37F9S6_9ARCH|nr:hypothetical protein GCM10007108_12410 [Thermogymnomonas acidicola]
MIYISWMERNRKILLIVILLIVANFAMMLIAAMINEGMLNP